MTSHARVGKKYWTFSIRRESWGSYQSFFVQLQHHIFRWGFKAESSRIVPSWWDNWSHSLFLLEVSGCRLYGLGAHQRAASRQPESQCGTHLNSCADQNKQHLKHNICSKNRIELKDRFSILILLLARIFKIFNEFSSVNLKILTIFSPLSNTSTRKCIYYALRLGGKERCN